MISLFWVSISILFFCYIGYGIILLLLNTVRTLFVSPKKTYETEEWLPVTMIIASYNEEEVLEQKIRNTLAIDYPPEKLHVIFVTDGSTDRSAEIIRRYAGISLLEGPIRRGKAAAIKRAMKLVQTPIVLFSDANAMLNRECIRRMLLPYQDPRIGGVAGEKKIINNHHISSVGEAEGLYWQYESFMKKQDAGFNTVVGAAGELFSIRTPLFKELHEDLILDDFVTSMQVCLQGYRIAYEPGAYATELPSASLAEEEKRKVRIAAGAYQSIGYLKTCLNIFKFPLLGLQFISRRLLRWVCCPFLLLILAFSAGILAANHSWTGFYAWFLYAQILFYSMAVIGWSTVNKGRKAGLLTIPFYFVFMNYCLMKGLFKFLKGRQTVLWEKSVRQAME